MPEGPERGDERWIARMVRSAPGAIQLALRMLGGEAVQLRAMALTYISLFALVPGLVVAFSVVQAFTGMDRISDRLHEFLFENLAVGARDDHRAVPRPVHPEHPRDVSRARGRRAARLVVREPVPERRPRAQRHLGRAAAPLGRAAGDHLLGRDHARAAAPRRLGDDRPLDPLVPRELAARLPRQPSRARSSPAPSSRSCTSSSRTRRCGCGTPPRAASSPGSRGRSRSGATPRSCGRSVRYSAIYGSVAAIPIFLLWLYLSWAILLFGARLAFVFQYASSFIRGVHAESKIGREIIGGRALLVVARAFDAGSLAAPDPGEIASQLGTVADDVSDVLGALKTAGLVVALGDGGLVPGEAAREDHAARRPARPRRQGAARARGGRARPLDPEGGRGRGRAAARRDHAPRAVRSRARPHSEGAAWRCAGCKPCGFHPDSVRLTSAVGAGPGAHHRGSLADFGAFG